MRAVKASDDKWIRCWKSKVSRHAETSNQPDSQSVSLLRWCYQFRRHRLAGLIEWKLECTKSVDWYGNWVGPSDWVAQNCWGKVNTRERERENRTTCSNYKHIFILAKSKGGSASASYLLRSSWKDDRTEATAVITYAKYTISITIFTTNRSD